MEGYSQPQGFSERRRSVLNRDDLTLNTAAASKMASSAGTNKLAQSRPPRGPPTPSMTTPAADFESQPLTGSPPPPPTPAASPGPGQMRAGWPEDVDVHDAEDEQQEDGVRDTIRQSHTAAHAQITRYFRESSASERMRLLADLLSMCESSQLSYVHQFVSPLLKKDPFTSLPDELCLRILSFIDDPKVLARASQVSRRWRDLVSDELTWKNLCHKHDYGRRLSEVYPSGPFAARFTPTCGAASSNTDDATFLSGDRSGPSASSAPTHHSASSTPTAEGSASASRAAESSDADSMREGTPGSAAHAQLQSYKYHFKQRYLVEAAWRSGGTSIMRNLTSDAGVVTSLHLTHKYIMVALDNAKIHVFDPEGNFLRVLQGHIMGVWAMVPWEDTLVSGGCDRDVRVWNLATGECVHVLRGHTSTVRCLKMVDENTAISGSRDTTLRVWDIRTGTIKSMLVGHQASVRCLEIHGDLVVSGSYDTTAKVWSISEGQCLQTLSGHFSQIYAIAFDGKRVATGSLDTSVRIWDARSGECLALLQGHTSLVGQLHMRGDTLVTGGSDGSVRVWSLERMCPIHRLAAHDNSVTSLQFDDTRVVSGGSDGRVKVWDIKTGQLVRELISPAEAVWRVAFVPEKCVAVALRNGRTVMEVYSFSPPEDAISDLSSSSTLPKERVSASKRPSSASNIGRGQRRSLEVVPATQSDGDVNMMDAGPSTAPLMSSFFRE